MRAPSFWKALSLAAIYAIPRPMNPAAASTMKSLTRACRPGTDCWAISIAPHDIVNAIASRHLASDGWQLHGRCGRSLSKRTERSHDIGDPPSADLRSDDHSGPIGDHAGDRASAARPRANTRPPIALIGRPIASYNGTTPVDLYAVDAATVYGLGILLEQLWSWPSTYRSSFDGRLATA
jgi:hypothetical protein